MLAKTTGGVEVAFVAAPAVAAAAALRIVACGLTGAVHNECMRACNQAGRLVTHLPGADVAPAKSAVAEIARTLDDIRGIACAYGRLAKDPGVLLRVPVGCERPLGQEMTEAIRRRVDHAELVVDYMAALHGDRALAIAAVSADRYEVGFEPSAIPEPGDTPRPEPQPAPTWVFVAGALAAALVLVWVLSHLYGGTAESHALAATAAVWSCQ